MDEDLRRYSRHVILPEIGADGQRKIRRSRVLVVGAGGLGSPVALYLAAAGVGRLGLVDDDRVELTNLHRQLLHSTPDIGRHKTESAVDALRRINPDVEVMCHATRLSADNVMEIVREYDLVVDGSDNLPTRYVVNDACVLLRKPNVYGAVYRFEGQVSVLAPHLGGPCYRCMFPEPPDIALAPSCADAGVLGTTPGIIGCLQATETLKLLVGCGMPLIGRLLVCDTLGMRFRELKTRRDLACPVCGENPTIKVPADYKPHRSEAQRERDIDADEVDVVEMKRALDNPQLAICVLDVREPSERASACVQGTIPIPLGQLHERLGELDPRRTYYVVCMSGMCSLHAAALMKERGFTSVKSVRGGMLAWAEIAGRGLSV